MATLIVYFVIYALCTGIIELNNDNKYMVNIFDCISLLIMILGFSLFLYTIIMMRKAHATCAFIKISNKGTYIICSLYAFVILLQLIYLIINESDATVAVVALLH